MQVLERVFPAREMNVFRNGRAREQPRKLLRVVDERDGTRCFIDA